MRTQLQTALKRMVGDKILLALVLAAMLILGVGVVLTQDDDKKKTATVETPAPPAVSMQPGAQLPPPAVPVVDAQLATDFVKWWLSNSMDYKSQTAKASHNEAFRWMTPESARAFQSSFWSPEIEAGVISGQVNAAFQPISVQAEAVNPDGTVVVGATGTLVVQANGTPMTQQLACDFLVRREKEGLRIAGLYNRQAATASAAGIQ